MKTKTILIFIAVIGAVVLVVFVKNIELGSVIATLFGGLAALKAKFFETASGSLEDRQRDIDEEVQNHQYEQGKIPDKLDRAYQLLRYELNQLDSKSDKILLKIEQLEKDKTDEMNSRLSDDEILHRLKI